MSDVTAARGRRPVSRGRAILVVLVTAGIVFAAAAPAWVRTEGSTALDAHVAIAISGTRASTAIGAAALVLLAAGGALSLVGRVGRWVVVAVVVAAGILVTATALGVIADPVPIATAAAAEQTGAGALSGPVRLTAFPYVAAVVGVAVVAVGAFVARVSGAWSTSSRHDVRTTTVPDDDHSAWDALTRGDDPT